MNSICPFLTLFHLSKKNAEELSGVFSLIVSPTMKQAVLLQKISLEGQEHFILGMWDAWQWMQYLQTQKSTFTHFFLPLIVCSYVGSAFASNVLPKIPRNFCNCIFRTSGEYSRKAYGHLSKLLDVNLL